MGERGQTAGDFLGEEITYRDRPGGARGLHRPGEEVAGVGRLTNPT